ncbi:MAG: hypothetical protein DBX48_02010 [Limosilactobacillus fermentum]|nr:MAG: hypothetical protein DBX48_02010 [Limosilactobacillus fermentum]
MKKIKRLIALMGVFVFISSSVLTVGATDEKAEEKEVLEYLDDGTAENKDLNVAPDDLKKWVGKGRTLMDDWENYSQGIATADLADGTAVRVTPNSGTIWYGSWSTCKFDVSGRLGYCAQPNSGTPSGVFTSHHLNNDLVKILLMCAPGGPLDGKIGGFPAGSIFYDPNVSGGNVYANAHACIGYAYSGQTTGLSYSYIAGINRMLQLAKNVMNNGTGNYSPDADWNSWYVCVVPNSAQDIVWLESAPKKGNCKVKKTSSNPEITNGNSCYSLKDATYGIYRNSNCSDASWVATMTTNENGDSNTVTLDAGTYYVREGQAPKGYFLDKTVHTIQIKAGETYTLKVSDKPTMDPVGVLLGKVDKETNMNKPEGSLPMEGALFTVKFYAGVLSDSDPAADGKTATRTWVFRTNENGFTNYHPDFLESGDELYILPSGAPGIPMGTLTIQETQAPEGYLINPQVFTVKITSNNNGSEFVYTYNEPKVLEQSLDLNIVKKEKNKDYAIEGAVFEHTLPDGTTETVTTDANGRCKFKALGYGQHKIREVSVPDEYTVNEGIVTFTVAKDNKITLDSNTAADNSMQFVVQPNGTASLSVEDTLAPYTLKVTKVNEKGKTLEGAEFTIYTDKDCQKELAKIVTDSNGVATTEPLTVEKKYYLKETKAPQGYRIPKDAKGNDYVYEVYTKINDKRQYEYYVNGELHTTSTGDYAIEGTVHERIVNLKVVNQIGLQMPETGTHTTLILVAIGVACMITALLRQLKKGEVEDKENEKNEKL